MGGAVTDKKKTIEVALLLETIRAESEQERTSAMRARYHLPMPLTCENVLAELERNAETLRGFGVKRIGVFGSVARGEARVDSDLDLLVELERLTFSDYFGLLAFLEDHFARKIDLVTTTAVRPEIEPYILQDVVYAAGV